MTPTEIHGTLDTKGLLDDAHGAGAYGLQVETPDSVEAVARQWFETQEHAPQEGYFERLTAPRIAYVGGSKDVYGRLQDHGESKVRKATFLSAFEVVDVIDVWPSDEPFREERERAYALSSMGYVVYCDGEIL